MLGKRIYLKIKKLKKILKMPIAALDNLKMTQFPGIKAIHTLIMFSHRFKCKYFYYLSLHQMFLLSYALSSDFNKKLLNYLK